MITKLNVPVTVTRTVTHRMILELHHTGRLRLMNAKGTVIDAMDLAVGRPQLATYTLDGADYCGAAIIQQSIWEIECRGEAGIVLGNVDFPYLRNATYDVYPQAQRIKAIQAQFEKTAAGAAIDLWVKDALGETRQRCAVPGPSEPGKPGTAFAVAFIAFTEFASVTEKIAQPKPGGPVRQSRLQEMSAGGEVSFSLPWGGGAPNPVPMVAAL